MPNGGSDCCGTCWFNSNNEGKTGSHGAIKETIARCVIRDIEIPKPFWTYCANHPHHNKQKISVAIGPIYINDGYPYSRKLWKKAPDNEAVRLKLLKLLDEMNMEQIQTYLTETDFEVELIKQLQDCKEKRAIPGLINFLKLDLSNYRVTPPLLIRNKAIIAGIAIEALLVISEGDQLDAVKHFIMLGLNGLDLDTYDYNKDNFAIIRYHLVRGMRHVKKELAREILETAMRDPHPEIKTFATEIYNTNH